jgi:hypothetical protein
MPRSSGAVVSAALWEKGMVTLYIYGPVMIQKRFTALI